MAGPTWIRHWKSLIGKKCDIKDGGKLLPNVTVEDVDIDNSALFLTLEDGSFYVLKGGMFRVHVLPLNPSPPSELDALAGDNGVN